MINVTEHQNLDCINKKNLLIDQERYKKEKFNEKRKLRIQEVRRKSKEFAKKVRENVRRETDNQLKQIEKTKAEEMRSWQLENQQENSCGIQNESIPTTWNIGDAHKAAADEIARNEEWEVQKQIALCRGACNSRSKPSCKSPDSAKLKHTTTKENSKKISNIKKGRSASCNSNKVQDNNKENNEREPHCYAKVNIQHNSEESSDESKNNALKQKNRSNTHSNNRSNQNSVGILFKDPKKIHSHRNQIVSNFNNIEDDSITSSLDSCYEGEHSSFPSHKHNKKLKKKKKLKQNYNQQKLKKTPAVVMDIGLSDTSSSSLNIEDSHVETNQHFSRIYSKRANSGQESQPTVSEPGSRISQPASNRFTLISDLLKFQEQKLSKHLDNTVREIFKSPLEKNITESCSTKSPCLPSTSMKCPTKNILPSAMKEKSNVSKMKIKDLSDNSKPKDNSKQKPNKLNQLQLQKITQNIESKTSKVKFYDYKNKFTKEYDQNLRAKVTSEKDFVVPETNAIENAEIEKQIDQERQREITLLKKKSEIRGQKALEREKVRRDYEALDAKLELLTNLQQQQAAKSNLVNDDYLFSEVRLQKQADQRQKNINSAVENLLTIPSIIITCPEENNKGTRRLKTNTNGSSSESANLASDQESKNNSDSCSILLNYAENQSSQIKQDIKSCKNSEKLEKLKMLLDRMDSLKSELLEELRNSSTNDPIQNAIDLLSELRKEREDIMVTSTEKKDLEKREKILRKKEEILEKKLREFYDIKKKKNADQNCMADSQFEEISNELKNSDPSTDSTSCILAGEPIAISSENPLEIVIKVRDQTKKRSKVKQFSCKSPQKSLINPINGKKSNYPHKISTPIDQVKEKASTNGSDHTEYRSPPITIENNIKNICEDMRKTCEITLKNYISEHLQHMMSKNKCEVIQEDIQGDQRKSDSVLQKEKNQVNFEVDKSNTKLELSTLNPQLRKYVQRLLGMTRHSINMLAVSSSTITTPSSSIINNTNNRTESNEEDFERLERLQRFINENYSFLSEVEDSVKSNKTSSSTEDNKKTTDQKVWRKVLSTTAQSDVCPPKTILKKTTLPHVHLQVKQTDALAISNEKLEAFLRNYYEMNDSSRQRIAHLNDMINKIRLEKQKIMETTLSSNGAICSEPHSTEHLELTQKKQVEYPNNSNSTKASDSQVLDKSENQQINVNDINRKKHPEIEDEQMNLEKNKLTGISRDSGISLSRPVTAQDNRESPSVEAKKDGHEILEAFEPLLKNIPKPRNQYSADTENLVPIPDNQRSEKNIDLKKKKSKPPSSIKRYSSQITDAHELSTIFEIDSPVTSIIKMTASQQPHDQNNQRSEKIIDLEKKKSKPPSSIKRYSPQMTDEVAHELSTIFEIDTPVASIINMTVSQQPHDQSKQQNINLSQVKISKLPPINETEKKLDNKLGTPYQRFPTFEEYIEQNKIDISQFDPEVSERLRKEFQELHELAESIRKLKSKPVDNVLSYLGKDGSNTSISSLDLSRLVIKPKDNVSFCNYKEYLTKHKVSEESNTTVSPAENLSRSVKMSEEYMDKIDEKCLQSSSTESLIDVESELKRRNIMRKSFVYKKTSKKNHENVDISLSDLFTIDSGSKEKESAQSLSKLSDTEAKQSTKSKSNKFQHNFDHMGLNWASSMLKKSHQCKTMNNSSSSSSVQKTKKRCNKSGDFLKPNCQGDDDIQTDSSESNSDNRPVNLRKFITKELKKRTGNSNDSSNSTSLSDSLVSVFLKKFLDPNQIHNSENQKCNLSSDRQKKTSTPVELDKSGCSNNEKSSGTSSIKLFSGECRLSSVRLSKSGSSSKCDKD